MKRRIPLLGYLLLALIARTVHATDALIQVASYEAGKHRVFTAKENSLQVYDFDGSGRVVVSAIDAHKSVINCLETSEDGLWLVSGSGQLTKLPRPGDVRSIRVWETKTGKEVWSTDELPAEVRCVDVSNDSRTVLGVVAGEKACVWRRAKDSQKLEITGLHCGEVAYSFPPILGRNSRFVFGMRKTGEFAVWDIDSGKLRHRFKEKEDDRAVAFKMGHEDSRTLVALRRGPTIRLHLMNALDGRRVFEMNLGARDSTLVYDLAMVDDMHAVVVFHNSVEVWNFASGSQTWAYRASKRSDSLQVADVELSEEGRRLALAIEQASDEEKYIVLLNLEKREEVVRRPAAYGGIQFAFSKDGSLLAVQENEKPDKIMLLDAISGGEVGASK